MAPVLLQKCVQAVPDLDHAYDLLVLLPDIDELGHRHPFRRRRLLPAAVLHLLQPILGAVKAPKRPAAVHGAAAVQKILPESLDLGVIGHGWFDEQHIPSSLPQGGPRLLYHTT